MTVERFKFVYVEENESWDLQLDDDGDYVDYSDYLKLEAENATLVADLKSFRCMLDEMAFKYGQKSLEHFLNLHAGD